MPNNLSNKLEVILQDEGETIRFAHTLAKQLQAGDVVALSGELGAGKSVFSRALMRGLGVKDEALPSPTYAVIQEYEGRTFQGDLCKVAHMDWYRLESIEDVEMLGIRDFFSPPWILMIEWPERAMDIFPEHTCWVSLSYVDDTVEKRQLRLSAPSLSWLDLEALTLAAHLDRNPRDIT